VKIPRLHGTNTTTLLLVAAVALVTCTWSALSAAPPPAAPGYSASGELVRPLDYREWVFVSSGMGMTYGPAAATAERAPRFDNIFVTREAYQEFLHSGTWPDKTMLMLEIREADENVSINNGGRSQGALIAIEAEVKDLQRFPDGGWRFYAFGSPGALRETVAPLPSTAVCYACHHDNTAVENTFVQFYPTLFDVAKRLGTVKQTYDPTRRP
jgi:hypothetical protein